MFIQTGGKICKTKFTQESDNSGSGHTRSKNRHCDKDRYTDIYTLLYTHTEEKIRKRHQGGCTKLKHREVNTN